MLINLNILRRFPLNNIYRMLIIRVGCFTKHIHVLCMSKHTCDSGLNHGALRSPS